MDPRMTTSPRTEWPVLIAEDDPMLGRAMARMVERLRRVHLASSARMAREAIAQNARWCCLIVDVDLGDGDGLDVLNAIRTRDVDVPAAIVTSRIDAPPIQRAFALHASFVCKPVVPDALLSFVARATTAPIRGDLAVACALEDLVRGTALTAHEAAIIGHAVAGTPRPQIAVSLNIAPSTLKGHVRGLLRKLGASSLDAVALRVFRTAYGSPHVPARGGRLRDRPLQST